MSKYIVWGAGAISKALISYVQKKNIPVECIVDSNSKKWGISIGEIKIERPDTVFKNRKNYTVIIAVGKKHLMEVKAQLKQYGIPDENILLFTEFIKFDSNGSDMGFGAVTGYIPHSEDTVVLKSSQKDKIIKNRNTGDCQIIVHKDNVDIIRCIFQAIKEINYPKKYVRELIMNNTDKGKIELEKVRLYSYASEWSPEMYRQMCCFYIDSLCICAKHRVTIASLSYNDVIFYEGAFLYDNVLNIIPGELSFDTIEHFASKFLSVLLLMKRKKYERAFLFINNDLPDMSINDVCGHILGTDLDEYNVAMEKISEYYMQSDMDNLFQVLRQFILNIKLTERDVYQWDSYQSCAFDNLKDVSKWQEKQRIVVEMIKQTDATTMIDLAGNMGWYCVAMKDTMEHAIVADIDYNCIDFAYQYITDNRINNIYPIHINLVSPPVATYKHIPIGDTGIHPWKHSAINRYKSDVAVALAIVHHLVFSQQLSFEEIINQISLFSSNWLIIEYVHRDDEYMIEALRDNSQFDWYTEENFVLALNKRARIICRENTSKTRTVYLCKLK